MAHPVDRFGRRSLAVWSGSYNRAAAAYVLYPVFILRLLVVIGVVALYACGEK
jgi:hypothetical protein